ncbi:hypothetical protein BDF22DRAFT_696869 [Syncephalis plumigaleata]|nr:hypothetical protein BDF22DRAFT_696869 [Syncephalis plumigaleata]
MQAYRKWRDRSFQTSDAGDVNVHKHKSQIDDADNKSSIPTNDAAVPRSQPDHSYELKMASNTMDHKWTESSPPSPIIAVDILATSLLKSNESPFVAVNESNRNRRQTRQQQQQQQQQQQDTLLVASSDTCCPPDICIKSEESNKVVCVTDNDNITEDRMDELAHDFTHQMNVNSSTPKSRRHKSRAQFYDSSNTNISSNNSALNYEQQNKRRGMTDYAHTLGPVDAYHYPVLPPHHQLPDNNETLDSSYCFTKQQQQQQQQKKEEKRKSKKSKKKKSKKQRDNNTSKQDKKSRHKSDKKSTPTSKKALLSLPEKYRRPVQGLERIKQSRGNDDDDTNDLGTSYGSTKLKGLSVGASLSYDQNGVQCWSEQDLERVMQKQMAQIQAQREKEAQRRLRKQADEARREQLLNQWKSMVNDKLQDGPLATNTTNAMRSTTRHYHNSNSNSNSGIHPTSSRSQPSSSATPQPGIKTNRRTRPTSISTPSMPISTNFRSGYGQGASTSAIARRYSGSNHSGYSTCGGGGGNRIYRWLSESFVGVAPSDQTPSPPVSFRRMSLTQLASRDGCSARSGDIPEETSAMQFPSMMSGYPASSSHPYHQQHYTNNYHQQQPLLYMNQPVNYNQVRPYTPNSYFPYTGYPMSRLSTYSSIHSSPRGWPMYDNQPLNNYNTIPSGLEGGASKLVDSDSDDNEPLTAKLLRPLPPTLSSASSPAIVAPMFNCKSNHSDDGSDIILRRKQKKHILPTVAPPPSLAPSPISQRTTRLHQQQSMTSSFSSSNNSVNDNVHQYTINNVARSNTNKATRNSDMDMEADAAWSSIGNPPPCVDGWRGVVTMTNEQPVATSMNQRGRISSRTVKNTTSIYADSIDDSDIYLFHNL